MVWQPFGPPVWHRSNSGNGQGRHQQRPRLGEDRQTQQKAIQGEGTRDQSEWQVMVGNKEVYEFGFKYLDRADIAKVSYPAGRMLIERLEYGEAIGMPVALQIKGEGTIPATDARLLRLGAW